MHFSIKFVAPICCWGSWERNRGSLRTRKYEDAYLWMTAKCSKKRALCEYNCNFWMDCPRKIPYSQIRYKGLLKGFQALVRCGSSSMRLFVLVVWKVGISTDSRIPHRKKQIDSLKGILSWPHGPIWADDDGARWRELVPFHGKWQFTDLLIMRKKEADAGVSEKAGVFPGSWTERARSGTNGARESVSVDLWWKRAAHYQPPTQMIQ